MPATAPSSIERKTLLGDLSVNSLSRFMSSSLLRCDGQALCGRSTLEDAILHVPKRLDHVVVMRAQHVARLPRGVHVHVTRCRPADLDDLPEAGAERLVITLGPLVDGVRDVYRAGGAAVRDLALEDGGEPPHAAERHVRVEGVMDVAPAPGVHVRAAQLLQLIDGLVQRTAQLRGAGGSGPAAPR